MLTQLIEKGIIWNLKDLFTFIASRNLNENEINSVNILQNKTFEGMEKVYLLLPKKSLRLLPTTFSKPQSSLDQLISSIIYSSLSPSNSSSLVSSNSFRDSINVLCRGFTISHTLDSFFPNTLVNDAKSPLWQSIHQQFA